MLATIYFLGLHLLAHCNKFYFDIKRNSKTLHLIIDDCPGFSY